jgi:chromosome segregation ATPase
MMVIQTDNSNELRKQQLEADIQHLLNDRRQLDTTLGELSSQIGDINEAVRRCRDAKNQLKQRLSQPEAFDRRIADTIKEIKKLERSLSSDVNAEKREVQGQYEESMTRAIKTIESVSKLVELLGDRRLQG